MGTREESFTARWSRLKRERADELPAETDDTGAAIEDMTDESTAEAAIDEDAMTDSELLEKYALPDPDLMKSGDNFSAFMKKSIPDRLRRRALRVLWGSNPVLANLDELVDYGEDYTDAATVIENMQSIYQVGKGAAWKFQEEQARIAEAEAEAAERAARTEAEAEPDESPPDAVETASATAPDPGEAIDEEIPVSPPLQEVAEQTEDSVEPEVQRPRPMRFAFD